MDFGLPIEYVQDAYKRILNECILDRIGLECVTEELARLQFMKEVSE